MIDLIENIPRDILQQMDDLDLSFQEDSFNPSISDALHSTVLNGGKRLRPLLTMLFGKFLGVPVSEILPYARAIEMVHAASLAHDDVIDLASHRRGNPSINRVVGNKKAVLSGDYLLAQVIVELCQEGRLELVKEMSYVISALSEGEWLQTESGKEGNLTSDYVREIALKKTASVLSYCTVAPALYSRMPRPQVELAREFGKELGLAFQMVDDILDYEFAFDTDDRPKDGLQDLKNGLVNSVTIELFDLMPSFKSDFLAGKFQTGCSYHYWPGSVLKAALERVKNSAALKVERGKEILTIMDAERAAKASTDEKAAEKALVFLLDYLITRKF